MMSKLELKEDRMLEVQFVGDDDVLNHILDREADVLTGAKLKKERTQLLVNTKKIIKKPEYDLEEDDQEVLKDQNYVEVLGRDIQESLKNGSAADGGNKVYSFQNRKHSEKMAKLASELAKTPRKNVSLSLKNDPEIINIPQCSKGHSASDNVQLKNNDKSEFLSTAPSGLKKRLIVPRSHSDSESEYSTSNSEDDDGVAQENEEDTNEVILNQKIPSQNRAVSAPVCKETPSKKMKRDKTSDLVEEYFEAHSSSKVLTSDRTLQKLKRAKLDQQTLRNLLSKVSPSFSAELKQLSQQYEQLFHKWMLQLRLGFNIVLYGLGSKRDLLERFRTTVLQDSIHVVINGFFPGISVKSILNSITEEVLNHMGTFRSVLDQLDWIVNKFKEDSSLELFLLIHNLDSQMLRGDKSQQIIGQLSSLRNIYLIASIDHLNAPLMWDHAKQSLYNWLWYETTTYSPYTEETSYENSLLVKQSGSLPLSSLIHVLRSLTPNARGIFRLLIKYQLDNLDNPSYIGLSFQDFYQQCREAFLVNSDLTLRAQLTEFRDHKLIRTKKGTDGVEYLLIPVDNGTLRDFLEREEEES
ncbi:origin recognition complex subunit 2 isoform X1 [Canis lupus baileyi]|uniref:origin recognition complex subunit 2 isoform X1 n=1 Tax=Canis lupus familiaris TaxID=9615 RepID=UPI0006B3DF7F|nr:origin recognition complex subunit 2 isoform X1 [Canis lupus familiaris]XP_013966408.1 origin recognition complex subunit 2 isoform X1 [Canis lupus familiaris]XP_025297291.1 origin recognition complex subunit 2 isoform X1 [Canis lupus dingo]XP_025297292.1 origin recognition complex subunit 2 isoform X1 [Canis lupus dingo]XP_038303477.1 origin recognition complex subunit 2 isoform X1 [Canis lupus familiaris]XP_038303478.1 origin recognition complex subunit 2 isoform X1 [Canis lupus familiari|eukprot:XP_013966407.1 origin recognition complex subunit 2 isoform X1 [Canis lupus familiaris]